MLTMDQRRFLQAVWNNQPLGLADRAADKVRQFCRRNGYVKYAGRPRRWEITKKGCDALRANQEGA